MKNSILILTWFQNNFPDIVSDMKNCTHHYDTQNLNPYHLEGDIWTHTMMVFNEANRLTDDINVLFAALLHDVEKPASKTIKEDLKRVRFFNHENMSTFKAIDILKQFQLDYPNINIDMKEILLLINWHSDFHQLDILDNEFTQKTIDFIFKKYPNQGFLNKMIILNQADNNGRFVLNDDQQGSQLKFDLLKSLSTFDVSYTQHLKYQALMLVGIPASGKSTYIKEFLKDKNKEDWVILSTDNLIQEKYPELNYNEAFQKVQSKNEFNSIENIFYNNLKIAVKDRKNIILDQTNLTKKSRRKKLSIIPDKYYKKSAAVFLIGKKQNNEFILKRKNETNKFIPENVIDNMIKNFIVPGLDEFNEVEYIIHY